MKLSRKLIILISFSVFLLCFVSSVSPYQLISNNYDSDNYYVRKDDSLSTQGSPITIFEYANRTDLNYNLLMSFINETRLTDIDKATISLPPTWNPYNLEGQIINLQEKRNWVNDSKFETSNNWNGFTFHNNTNDNWEINMNGLGPDDSNSLYFKMDSYTDGDDSTSYQKLDALYFSQNISNINRGEVTEAYLSFDYKVNAYSWDLSSLGYNIFVTINTSRNLQKEYAYWSTSNQGDPNNLGDYDVVIWSVGDLVTDILSSQEQTLISNYLSSGGKVFLSGSSIAYDSTQVPNRWDTWLDENFNVSYVSYETVSSINGISDPFNDISNMALTDAIGVDYVQNNSDGIPCLEYNTGNTCGVRSNNNNTMFFSFNFASINSLLNRTLMLNKTINTLNSSCEKILIVDDGTVDSAEKIISALDNIGYQPEKNSIDVELFSQKNSIKRIYTIPFNEIPDKNIWDSTGLISVDPSYFHLPNINLKVGLQSTSSVTYSGSDPAPELWIDNLYLILKASINPSDVNLTVNNITVQNSGTYGNGNFQQTNNFVYNSSTKKIETIFSWNPLTELDYDAEVSFDCKLNLFTNKSSEVIPQLSTSNALNNSWIIRPYITIPTGYWNHHLNFSKPLDWNITGIYEPLNGTNNLISLCKYGNLYESNLKIPTTNITDFPDGYWEINAESINYIKNSSIQILDSDIWVNNQIFYPGNKSRIIAQISNLTDISPENVENYEANLTIIDPDESLWYFNSTGPLTDGLIIFPNMTFSGTNSSEGLYYYKIEWVGNNQGGYIEGNFKILHNLMILPNNPTSLAAQNMIYKKYGQAIYLEVYLNDTDLNLPILNAGVYVNWTNATYHPINKQLNSLGGGYYGTNLETAYLPTEGIHTIIINASKQNFVNFSNHFEVDARTTSIHVLEPSFQVPIGDLINITASYNDSFGNPISNGNLTYNEPTLGSGNLTEYLPGFYFFTVDSSELEIGNYYINLNSEKYGSISSQALLLVNKINTDINYTKAISVETLDSFLLRIYINDTDHGNGLPVSSVNVSYVLDTLSGNLTDEIIIGNIGYYNTTINATLIPKAIPYDLIISFTHENYSFPSVIISVTVQSIQTDIYPLKSIYEIYYNGLINLSVTYNFSNGDPINGANLTYLESTIGSGNLTELGEGVYYFTINSSVPIGTYSILVSCNNYGYTAENILLKVEAINTDVNYTSAISVETLETFNVRIFVNDTDHNMPIIGINATYELLSLNGNLTDENFIGNAGFYNTTINTTLSPRDVPYYLVITLDKQNYTFSQIYISVTVKPLTTNIYPLKSIFEIYYNGLINISVSYNFTNGNPIIGANLTYFETVLGSGNLTELGNGIYYFTINSTSPLGIYSILISCEDYGFTSTQAILDINPINTEINYTSAISVETLNTFNVRIYLNDTDHDVPIEGVNVTYTLEHLSGNLSDESPTGYLGYYNTTIIALLSPRDVPYSLIITLIKDNHSFSQIYITVTVKPITTYIYPLESIYEIFYNGLINLSVTYNFSNGNPIIGANLTYFETVLGFGNLTELGNGVYYFTINSSVPLGIYSILISCEDYGFTSARAVLDVNPINTEINYTSAISVETLDTFNVRIYLNDTDHDFPIEEVNVTYTLEYLSGYLTDESLDGNFGYYNTTINATLATRDVPYNLIINLEKENYSFSQIIISVTIKPLATNIYPTKPSFAIYYNAEINITVTYNFSSGEPIIGANLSYLEPTIGSDNLNELGGGLYYFTVNSSYLGIGTHSFEISCTDYGFSNTQAILIISPIQTNVLYNSSITVKTLESFNLRVYLNDTDHIFPISSANIDYTLSSIVGNLTDESIDGEFGYYNTTITANLQPRDAPYSLILTIDKQNYSFSNIVIPVIVQPIVTYIYSLEPFFEVSYKNMVNISVSYNFSNGDPISGANLSIYETYLGSHNLIQELNPNGSYYYTLNSSHLSIGTFYLLVSCSEYGFVSTQIILKVNPIQINLTEPKSLVYYPGDSANFKINLRELIGNYSITQANISYFFQGFEGFFTENTSNPGNYYTVLQINLPARDEPYAMIIKIEKENYETETFTIQIPVINPPSAPTPWYIQWGWLLGIAGALGAVLAGYSVRGKLRARHWERKINRLYIIHAKDGVAIYDRALTKKAMDSQLVSAALMGITGMIRELTSSQKKLKAIDHMDKKVIFEYGNNVIGAILADTDLPVIRKKLKEFIDLFEIKYQAQLLGFSGDIAMFKNIDKLTNTIFPFSQVVTHREPVPKKEGPPIILNKELLNVLNSINDGLKENDLIAAYNNITIDQATLDLVFLIDNGFIDNMLDLKLTEKGIMAIYYSTKVSDIKKLDDKTNDDPMIPRKTGSIPTPTPQKETDADIEDKPRIPKKPRMKKLSKEKFDDTEGNVPRLIDIDEEKKDIRDKSIKDKIKEDKKELDEFEEINISQPRIPKIPKKLEEKSKEQSREKSDEKKEERLEPKSENHEEEELE
jgi:hypothetical protein